MIVPTFPGLAAAAEGEWQLAAALLVPGLALASCGYFFRKLRPAEDLRRIEAVAALALVFIISALVAVPGFMVLGLSFVDACFEAVSGITTTGFSVSTQSDSWPIAAHVLRAWIQWCGGIVVAVAGLALLMDASGATRTFGEQTLGDTGYLASTRETARVILIGYTVLTLVGIALTLYLVDGWWEGPLVALAAISTGGFAPQSASLANYSLTAQIVVMSLCVAGSVTLPFYAIARDRGIRYAMNSTAVRATLGILFLGACVYTLAYALLPHQQNSSLIEGLLNYVSAQTTAGFAVSDVPSSMPSLLILIVAMVIGGDVGSTSGGLKTARCLNMLYMIKLVFLRLKLPERAVTHVKSDGKRIESSALIYTAALLGVYLLSLLLFWLILLMYGYNAMDAMFDAASALSGVGLSTGVIGPDMAHSLKVLTIFAMLLGRLEFFALLVLLLPSTWIKRK